MEDGAVAFDLAQSKYSISGERNKCVLHLWSSERDVVRRVIEAEMKNEVLRLEVQRLGQAHPSKLEICRERERRTPTAKRAARLPYARVLQRVLEKNLRGYTVIVADDGISQFEPYQVQLTRWQLLNQPGFANADNTPLKTKAVTLSRMDLISFVDMMDGGEAM